MSNNGTDIYEKLRETIDSYSVGLSPTESGKEIGILKRLFTEEEAKVYLAMSRSLETAETIARRLNQEKELVKQTLENMTRKGLTFPRTREGVKFYAAAPFMHGFFEHQVFREDQDARLAQIIEDYLLEGFIPRKDTLRTVPVQVEAGTDRQVLPYDDVKKIIMEKEKIGLVKCACAHQLEMVEKPCDKPDEVCIAFDFYAEYSIEEMGFGRWITREEALKVLDQAEEEGLVHQVGQDIRNTECICNCCANCCTILRLLKMIPQPAVFKSSNYYVHLEAKECTACGTCIERCPMEAIEEEGEAVNIDPGRCIGCGLCTTTCPTGAMTLHLKPEEQVKGPRKRNDFMRSSLDFDEDILKGLGYKE